MIRETKDAPLPPLTVRLLVDRHPLGITGLVLGVFGLALTVGGAFVMLAGIAASALLPISAPIVLIAGGVAVSGIVLTHQGIQLRARLTKAAMQTGTVVPVH